MNDLQRHMMMTTSNPPQVSDIFDTETSFASLGLDPKLLKGIEALGFEHPTHVQSKLLRSAASGKDILGQSKTGTGKTAAFGLPTLQHLMDLDPEDRKLGSLILTPTRELAIQVSHELRNLARFTDVKVVPIYGGQRMKAQIPKLEKRPEIIVGTPGRVMDFHRRGLLPYDRIRVAVLDEVDRMLDIGFRDDIRQILGSIKQKHQTIFVSATISDEIDRLARQYLKNAEKLVLSASSLTVSQVDQYYIPCERWDKNRMLVHMLKHEDPALTLVFCRTKRTVDSLAEYLKRKKIDAHAMHGDMYQTKRNRVMEMLRGGHLSVLVASDLAARGIDVDDISHVVNYDLPEDPEVYVHRIGRTARAGRDGVAWSLVSPDQGELLTAIEKLTNVEVKVREFTGFEPGPVPRDIAAQQERDRERGERHRAEASRTNLVAPDPKKVDESLFPGGIVPAEAPAKRMGGRIRTRRR